MLSPDTRTLYTSALTPPSGYVYDCGVATTFSLDLTTLLTIPVHLAILGQGRADELLQDSVRLLEAIRRITDLTTVYVQRGRMQVPRATHLLYGLLEPVVVEVKAPKRGGLFHPKIWVLRYKSTDSESTTPLIRVLVLSRNLTNDRSWDVCLQLEGSPGGSYVVTNRPLGTLVARLPKLAMGAVSEARQEQARQLADEVRRTKWDLPWDFESVSFHVNGLGRSVWHPPVNAGLSVISPFCSEEAVRSLTESSGDVHALVSRPETLSELPRELLERFDRVLVFDDAAESEDGEETADLDTYGLHAKIYVTRRGWKNHVFVGSANATNAAIRAGRNVEVMAELVSRGTRDSWHKTVVDSTGLGDLLVEYDLDTVVEPPDAEKVEANRILEIARSGLSDVGLTLRCEADEQDTWRLQLEADSTVHLPEEVTACAWLVSMSPDKAQNLEPLRNQRTSPLGRCSTASVTGIVAFQIAHEAAGVRLRFALNLPVDGLPEGRDGAILRTVVANREGFLRYLLMLLGGLGGEDVLGAVGGLGGKTGFFGGLGGGADGMPLLEELARVWCREPDRLQEVDGLIDKLRETPEGEELIPSDFLQLWQVFVDALEEFPP